MKTQRYKKPYFSWKNKIRRSCWNLIYILLFRPSPTVFHGWRCLLLRLFGAQLGSSCHIYPSTQVWAPWNLQMDSDSCLGKNVNCYNMGRVYIGKNTVISQGVHICAGSHDYSNSNFDLIIAPVYIGKDVWICADAFISLGIEIGEGSVIGARSVVTKSQPAWMISAGNPCRPIKPRNYRTLQNS